jgi:hypothetical protein
LTKKLKTVGRTFYCKSRGFNARAHEGPVNETNKRYENAVKWLTTQPTSRKKKEKQKTSEEKKPQKKDNRGGPRRTLYTPKISELVEEGFFKRRKSLDEVIEGLLPKNVPTRGHNARNAIVTNLRRRISKKGGELKGAKEEDVWYFWTD